jgi:putative exosortase-associated protein (TIGR04073 family)
MRNVIPFLTLAALAAMFTAGCAGPEEKLGLGVDNTFDIVRLGELRRSVEQAAVFDSPDVGYTTGFIHGVDRTIGRTGMGIFQIVTFPIPPYHPIATKYFAPEPPYPANYKPGLLSDSLFDTDTYIGYSGGDVAPLIPGSRFRVFDN